MKTSFARIGTALACCLLAVALLAAPAVADPYPVSGKWGVSTSTQKGPIDCGKLRVISFNGEQRTDSGGGVPAFRNSSITRDGLNRYQVVDVFTNGMISDAQRLLYAASRRRRSSRIGHAEGRLAETAQMQIIARRDA